MSNITEAELDQLLSEIHRGMRQGPWVEHLRLAVNELLATRVKAETKPMHEPVSGPEVLEMAAAAAAVAPGEFFFDREERMRAAGNTLLARRAAATRADVVVTKEDVKAAWSAFDDTPKFEHYTWRNVAMRNAMQTFADRLNGKLAAPVDPRAGIVLSWANNTLGAQNVLDEDIASLLAKLDEVKP